MQVALRRPVPAVAVFVVAIFVVLSACSTVQLVSYYDEPTDRALTALQKVAAAAILTSAEGMTAVAVQAALNAALKVVKDVVNGKAGFALI